MNTIKIVGSNVWYNLDKAVQSVTSWYRNDEFAKEGLAIILVGMVSLPFILG